MKKMLAAAAAVLVTLAVVALMVVRPWEVGDTQQALDEALPAPVGAEASPDAEPSATPAPTPEAPATSAKPEKQAGAQPKRQANEQPSAQPEPAEPAEPAKPAITELGGGEFEDAEYVTTGTARIVELADGSRFLRIENFSTSQAPVIQVAFSNAPSGGTWGSYDDVRFEAIGTLKALSGNQNYEIPKGLDLAGFKSVVIWCDKYDVALGTAPVQL